MWYHCGASIDWTSKISSGATARTQSSKQVSGPATTTEEPLLSQRPPFLNTVTVFQNGDPCFTETILEGPHSPQRRDSLFPLLNALYILHMM